MLAAVVNTASLLVVNIIVADAGVDPAPDGCELTDITNGPACAIGWLYVDGVFVNPIASVSGAMFAASSGTAA